MNGRKSLFDGHLMDGLSDSCQRNVFHLNINELRIFSLFDGCLLGRSVDTFVSDICPNMGNKIFYVNGTGHKI